MNLAVLIDAEGTSTNWIEEIQFEVDTCNGNIETYLEPSKDEPPSKTIFHIMEK